VPAQKFPQIHVVNETDRLTTKGESYENHILKIDRRNSIGNIDAGWRQAIFGLGPG
jgi:hypothetical protein